MFKSIEEFLELHIANGFEDHKTLDLYGFKQKPKKSALVGGRFIACTTKESGRLNGVVYEIQKNGSLQLLTANEYISPASVITLANSFVRYDMDGSQIGKKALFNYKPANQFAKPKQYKVTITHLGTGSRILGITEEGRKVYCVRKNVEVL